MSKTYESEKAVWAEKKRHGSKRARRAAISVQTARIIDRLLERSQGLSTYESEHPNNALTISKKFEGATDDRNWARTSVGHTNVNLGKAEESTSIVGPRNVWYENWLGRDKTRQVASIVTSEKEMLLRDKVAATRLEVDPKGKHKPAVTDSYQDGFPVESFKHTPNPEEMVRLAAPALYEIKKSIDDAAEAESHKAA
jgi:hypothetical protein